MAKTPLIRLFRSMEEPENPDFTFSTTSARQPCTLVTKNWFLRTKMSPTLLCSKLALWRLRHSLESRNC